ncbi:unnamed protein product [Penicillium pancosmium]
MSDPLSIAAGVAGFLSFGIRVTQTLVDFYSDYKNQDADIATIIQNMKTLQNTLRSLGTAVQQRQSHNASAEDSLLQEVDKATQNSHEIIYELQEECQKLHAKSDSGTGFKDRFQAAGRRATYPFRKSTLQKIEEDISEIRESLTFALSVLQLQGHNRIEDDILTVKYLLERTNTSQISFAIRAWLQAPDPSLNQNAFFAKHHPETGLWFIRSPQFTNWLIERDSFLWLNGFAGCGKSVLCSVIIHHTFKFCETNLNLNLNYGKVGIAYFYFAFSDESKQGSRGLLCALLLQLSVQLEDGEEGLDKMRLLSKSSTPPEKVLLETLRKFLERFQDGYILIDALDECPQDHRGKREDVLRVIQEMRDWRLPNVHLLVTSRDHLDIRRSLDPSPESDVLMEDPGIAEDISKFVSYQLKNDTKLQRWKVRHGEIQDKITEGAQGVFRYAECQLRSCRQARNRNQLDKCLDSLPRDLDETYERILCDIDETYVEDVRRILTVLCLSIQPLTVRELIEAHVVELSEEPPLLDREGRSYEQDDLVDICLGLIEIVEVENENGPEQMMSLARIAHFSVKEYLQSDRIRQQKSERFAIDTESANAELCQICLVYLLDPTFSLSDGVSDEETLKVFALAGFAAEHWFHYYQYSSPGNAKSEKLLLRLFQNDNNSFVNWVRLYEIDRPWWIFFDFDERPVDGVISPIYYASFLGLEDILRTLLAIHAEIYNLPDIINARFGHYVNALQAASVQGHKRVVQILLHHGADVNAQGGIFNSALEAASIKGHKEVVQTLLDHGADVNAQGKFNSYALHAASSEGHDQVVRILLAHGADANAQGKFDSYALHAASSEGHGQVVQILLDHGADVNAQGRYGHALHAASRQGHKEVVRTLLNHGADVNAQGRVYDNAIQAALREGHDEIVQMLLDQGADVSAEDKIRIRERLQGADIGKD